jgi:integrase
VRQICDGLGHIKMAELSPNNVSAWNGDAPRARHRLDVQRHLARPARDANSDLGLVHWACDRVKGSRPKIGYSDEEPNALTGDQLVRLFVAMREHEPLFATMAMNGMRFAEASALQWNDIDVDIGKIQVRRNQQSWSPALEDKPLDAMLDRLLRDIIAQLTIAPLVCEALEGHIAGGKDR